MKRPKKKTPAPYGTLIQNCTFTGAAIPDERIDVTALAEALRLNAEALLELCRVLKPADAAIRIVGNDGQSTGE